MEPAVPPAYTPRELVDLLWSRRRIWIATAGTAAVLAAVGSLVIPRQWEASQGLLVRQETAGAAGSRPGKFADLYEMRTLQETILEVAKSQQVVAATLRAVDRDLGGSGAPPTLEDIDKLRRRLKMLPPDGGEFGKTEVFYFSVADPSRDRAIRLVGELCRQLDASLRTLRAQRAESLVAELQQQAALAGDLLASETQRLVDFEAQVGSDLGELRMLHSANSGQSDLRTEVVQLEAEARKFRTQLHETEQLRNLLHAAQDDPQTLIATPNSLLATQPALRRLKEGLIDAQLATSRLGGTRSSSHPRVLAAMESEQQIRDELHNELLTAIRGAEVEVALSKDRLAAAEQRLGIVQRRLNRLAELRAEYSNRVAQVENCRLTLDRARQDLNLAKTAQAAAHSSSLVTRLDQPETGPHPAGPGRTVITAAGGIAGLMLGLGLCFVLGPTSTRPAAAASPVASRSESRPSPDATTPPPEAAPTVAPVAAVAAAPTTPRPRRETLPAAAAVLPKATGSLPVRPVGSASGSPAALREALQAAARRAP